MRIEHKLNKSNFIFWEILVLSLTGLVIFQVGSSAITLFYPFGALLIITRLLKLKRCSHDEIFILVWGIFVLALTMVAGRSLNIISAVHFLFYFLIGVAFVSQDVSNVLERVLKLVITINFYNVLIALALYLFEINNDFLSHIFITYYDRGSMRFCGFTSEPSYLAMILTFCLLSLIFLNGTNKIIKLKKWIFYYVVTILLAKSSFGLLSLLVIAYVVIKKFWNRQKSNIRFVIAVLTVFLGIIFTWTLVQFFMDFDYMNRIIKIVDLLFTSNSLTEFVYQLRFVDSSAWHRLGPTFGMIAEMQLTSMQTWFGHGIGSDVEYFTSLVAENTVMRLGFIPTAIYNFGFLGGLSFLVWILKKAKKLGTVIALYTVLCFTNCAFSTQAFWFIVLLIVWASKYIEVRDEKYGKKTMA